MRVCRNLSHRLEDHRRGRRSPPNLPLYPPPPRARRPFSPRRPRNPPLLSQSFVPRRLAPLPRLAPRRPPPRWTVPRPHPPGPPGAGKTFAARILRSVIDPCASPLTPIPYSVRDLLTLARHNWILAFDHLSALSPQLTDALCRLSSGLGATLRETSGPGAEPLQQYYKRPVLLTVTERWSCPADLARRALTVTFPPLTPRTEARLLTVFQQAWPDILAALCSAVAAALSRMNHIDPPSGRCPDALAWAMAASPALGCTGEEMRQAFALAEPHPMAEAVRNLLEQRRHFAGSATQLLELLQPFVGCHTPKGLSQQLRSCMLTLSDTRIELKFKRLGGGARIIELSDDPCDASCEKTPPDASQTLDPPPQPTEKEELTTP